MIERSFDQDEVQIEVSFQWDSGDRSAGIAEGWGEETGVCIKMGSMWMWFGFIVDDKPPAAWAIDDIQINQRLEEDPPRFKFLADLAQSQIPLILGDFPEVCKRVEQTWGEIQAIEAIERAGEDVWAAETCLHEADEAVTTAVQSQRLPSSLSKDVDQARLEREAAERAVEEAKAKVERLKSEYEEKYGGGDASAA